MSEKGQDRRYLLQVTNPFMHTIGHSNSDINTFINLLTDNNIKTLVDVRQYPSSRATHNMALRHSKRVYTK